MTWYVYKCNSRNEPHQNHFGEWRDFFDRNPDGRPGRWGTPNVVPALRMLQEDDTIIAYQTDRNCLMGVLVVDKWDDDQGRDYVHLRPLLRLGVDGVKVRPLKSDERIAEIDAFKTRQVKTLYDINRDDANYIVEAARKHCHAIEYGKARPFDNSFTCSC